MKRLVILVVSLLLLGLATPVLAQQQNNSDVPGSVLVFAKFIRGTVQIGTGRGPIAGPILAPRSEFNVSVTCPNNAVCAEGAKVKILAKWVCPASQNPAQFFICRANNFELFTTVKGTIRLNPESLGAGVAPNVPRPLCQRGFLIMWVVSPGDGSGPAPVKFDALVGHAILRNGNVSSGAYNGLPIQAVNQRATFDASNPTAANAFTDRDGDQALDFNGIAGNLGEYKQVTGQLTGSIRLERTGNLANSNLGPIRTFITMLTLDTLANRGNFPTFVDFHFFNEAEVLLSTSFEFICWAEIRITTIDPNLDQFFGTHGLFETTEAEKVAIFGVTDTAGPVTLIGIVETLEFRPNGTLVSEYAYNLFNDGDTVITTFAP